MKKRINRRSFMRHMGVALFLPLGDSADPNGIINAVLPAQETRGLEEPELTAAVLVPLAPVGVRLGYFLLHRISEQLVYRLCYFFLFVVGGKLLYDGFTGVLA